jgi:hypothetical protein
MRTVKLDFVARPQPFNPFGVLVLLAGLALVGYASWQSSRLDQEREQLEGRLLRLQQPAATASSDDTEALAAADKLTSQIRRPWVPMLQKLEQIESKGVRLDQILPQAGDKASVQLGGQADDAESLYAYLRQLRNEGGLQGVYLLQQHWDDETQTIRFIAQAQWRSGSEPGAAP